MPDEWARLLSGAVVAAGAAGLAFSRRSLSRSGAVAAVPVGAAVVTGGGWWTGLLLVLFFATSSALSRLRPSRPVADPAVRGSTRDAVQVVANGGVAALAAVAAVIVPDSAMPPLVAACAGAIAAATADTWATEVGALSPTPPRLLLGGGSVPPGTSGGVTPIGSAAAVAGALVIAGGHAIGVAFGWTAGAWPVTFWGTGLAGVAGGLADSLLGASVQAEYRCPVCLVPTERTRHRCGTPTRLVRGHPSVTNDVVNAAATAVGAIVGAATALIAA